MCRSRHVVLLGLLLQRYDDVVVGTIELGGGEARLLERYTPIDINFESTV